MRLASRTASRLSDSKNATPVAFVQIDSQIALIDQNGVVMEMPAGGSGKNTRFRCYRA